MQLEAVQAEYDRWSMETAEIRESAGQAKAELERRQAPKPYEPEVCSQPEPEPELFEPEPQASPEAGIDEPEAAEL